MEVAYTHNDYREMAKEVCFLTNDLKQLTDVICSKELFSDTNTQANATCSAIAVVDRLKNFLVQMNFITCNAVAVGKENEENVGLLERRGDSDSNIIDNNAGDDMELHNVAEGNSGILEDSQTGNVEEGNKENTEITE